VQDAHTLIVTGFKKRNIQQQTTIAPPSHPSSLEHGAKKKKKNIQSQGS